MERVEEREKGEGREKERQANRGEGGREKTCGGQTYNRQAGRKIFSEVGISL